MVASLLLAHEDGIKQTTEVLTLLNSALLFVALIFLLVLVIRRKL